LALIEEDARKDVEEYLNVRFPSGSVAKILTFTAKEDGVVCESCDQVKQLARELADIAKGRIIAENHIFEESLDLVKKFRVKRVPATVVTDEKNALAMKFYGMPSGYEFMALLDDVLDAAVGSPPRLNQSTIETLRRIPEPIHLQVFVTPTCPYCPRAVRMAHQFSLVNPEKIDAEMIESMEFPDLAEKYGVMAVPKIVINDRVEFEGALPEQVFLYKVKEALRKSQFEGGDPNVQLTEN
jgi:glutaredoxin-like protein